MTMKMMLQLLEVAALIGSVQAQTLLRRGTTTTNRDLQEFDDLSLTPPDPAHSSFSSLIFNFGGSAEGQDSALLNVYSCHQEDFSVLVPNGDIIALKQSSKDQVCLLQQVGDTGRTVARSYNGTQWEPRRPIQEETQLYVNFLGCEQEACALEIPNDGNQYHLKTFNYQEPDLIEDPLISISRTDPENQLGDQEVARFLIQATFGPTRQDVTDFPNSFSEWIQQQVELPASLHRGYFRSLASKIIVSKPPRLDKVCQKDSRWSRFAFGNQDIGKQLFQRQEGDRVILTVDGVDRTALSLSSWPHDFDGRWICAVVIHGFQLWILQGGCGNEGYGRRKIKAPYIVFPNNTLLPPDNTATFEGDNCTFTYGTTSRFKLYDGDSDNCKCTPPSDGTVVFKSEGIYHPVRFEDMTGFRQNSLEEPDPQACSSTGVSPVNHDHCIVVPGQCVNYNQYTANDQYSLSCGSPGEVKGNPLEGAVFLDHFLGKAYDYDGSFIGGPQGGPKTIWFHHAIKAPDQLRQRVAFALSGIFVSDLLSRVREEPAMAAYDIFVRHALGNYFDVMREVTYSWAMGDYLTYKDSKSFAVTGRHADENYGRELMQLFTIGVFKLHMNGTVITDESGEPIPTYTEDHVKSMARVWTGFAEKSGRTSSNGRYTGLLDPLKVIPEHHDQFPKMNLDGGYIGDGYPLCFDFPSQDFLHKGANYEFLQGQTLMDSWDPPLALQEGSPLYEALCNRNTASAISRSAATEPCNFQAKFSIPHNLACQGEECDQPTVDLVTVGTAIFRYVGRPCVTFPFYNDGNYTFDGMCKDPTWKTSCCGSKMPSKDFRWGISSCSPKLKVMPSGQVGIVHDLGNLTNAVHPDVNKTNLNLFRVAWDEGARDLLPTPGNCGVCEENGDSCLCSVEEYREPVFSYPPSRDELMENLHVGSVSPDSFSSGEYVMHSVELGGVTVYRKATGVAYDTDTIFAITNIVGQPGTKYLKNVISYVQVAGTPHLKFRNAPMFNLLRRTNNVDTLGAHNEIDAVLTYLHNHPNTPPFVAYRFIQRFATSNPSGSYVQKVAKAFESGRYGTFGTGKRGDLVATMAAVLLETEARSVVLDNDPTQGQMREPLLKFVHVLRTLEVHSGVGRFLPLSKDLVHVLDQVVYEPPSVFSFFFPDFSRANSVIQRQGLISPETQLVDYNNLITFLNYIPNSIQYFESKFIEESTSNDVQGVAAQLNTLLTGGRVPSEKVQLIQKLFTETPWDQNRVKWPMKVDRLFESFLLTPEFHTTNMNKKVPIPLPPPPQPQLPSPAKDFKAIVFVDLQGGADSMNMLVPHSGCGDVDLYEEYRKRRRTIALDKSSLLTIDVPDGQQECTTFGMPTALDKLHALYEDQDLMWVSNLGTLAGGARAGPEGIHPRGINSHKDMFVHLEHGWANARNDTGVMGRVADVLSDQHYRTRSFTTSGWGPTLAGSTDRSRPHDRVSGSGVPTLGGYYVSAYNITEQGSSAFAQYYRHQLDHGRANGAQINSALAGASTDPNLFNAGDKLTGQMKTIAKLIKQHEVLDMDRGFFTAKLGGWDTHGTQHGRIQPLLEAVNNAVSDFAEEMKVQGLFDNVVVVMRSEFGRTHKDNSRSGTDHGWNGNYFVVGGKVRGGQVLGEYPEMRNHTPKLSWEHLYNGLFEWMGVLPHQLSETLPRRDLFENLFTADDLMESS